LDFVAGNLLSVEGWRRLMPDVRLPLRAVALVLLSVGILYSAATPEDDRNNADEQSLRSAGVATDGPGLLKYLENLTVTASNRDKIKELVKKLGDNSYDEREKAQARLIALGAVSVPFLKEAANDPDLEVTRRADQALKEIQNNAVSSNPAGACRLIARKKPAGAVAILLGYLPCAEDEAVADEVRNALAAVALTDGKLDPALVAALKDKTPVVRGSAAEVLLRANAGAQKDAVAALLKDPEPIVRLRAGLALARVNDKASLPVLVDLLDKMPPEQLWPVEELLLRLAGDQAPSAPLGNDDDSRKKCHTAWLAWWRANGDKVDLARLGAPPPQLGNTLILLLDKGVVMEVDKKNKELWQFGELQFPLDVQYLPGDRVLFAEQEGGRVTERNRKGEIVWEKKFESPLVAQRLTNGHTFMANRSQLSEVDRSGKEVFSYTPPDGSAIMRASRLRNGDMALITSAALGNGGQFVRLDPKGKEKNRFNVQVATSGGRVDVLPNGHVLIPMMNHDKVVEYDANGKEVWEVNVSQPIVALRLPNGNTLITSMRDRRAVEVDRAGKEVWEFKSDTRVTRALRR
jgi:hypothetical protein